MGGVTANNVLYNFTGASGDIAALGVSTLYGTFLAPRYTISNAPQSVVGELIGSGTIKLNDTQVTTNPFSGVGSVPEPGSGVMLLSGVGLILLSRVSIGARRNRKKIIPHAV